LLRGGCDRTTIEERLATQIENDLQYRVLEFAQTLVGSQIHGIPGKQLLNFAGTISPTDIQLMREAIEQGCEQVDIDEW
jgi:hypothetical protein